MNDEQKGMSVTLSKGRFVSGVVVFAVGQASTLLIPFVTASGLSGTWKTTLSSVFFFITPQIGIVLAVAILGKEGFNRLKSIIFGWLKRYAPPEAVGIVRYRVGLVMFALPLFFGWLEPYFGHLIPEYAENRIVVGVIGDVMFVVSFFVLGGEFWDKVRALFIHGARVIFPGTNKKGGSNEIN